MGFKAKFQLTVKDLAALSAYINRKDGPINEVKGVPYKEPAWVVAAAIVVLCVLPTIDTRLNGMPESPRLLLIALEPLIVIAAMIVTLRVMRRLKGKQPNLLESLDQRGMLGPLPMDVEVELVDVGIRQQSTRAVNLMFWSGLWSIEENDKAIFIMLSALQGYILPKRAFATSSEADAFVNEARRLWLNATSQQAPGRG